jgi:hypothetical protein
MRHFVIVITREGRLRLKFLHEEHGLLHDKKEKKSYAIIRDAYPTNWAGKWSRAYVVHEKSAQTIHAGEPGPDNAAPDGATVEVREPLNMLARVRMPNQRGELGDIKETWLTAESIFDRTQSAQVRRLANRRFQWFHALLFVALGIAIGVLIAGTIALMSGGSPEGADAAGGLINPGPGAPPTSSGASEVVVVGPTTTAPSLEPRPDAEGPTPGREPS